jgi:thiamine-monophosphate kinase
VAQERGEFEIIARYFRPLTEGRAGALGLADDGALIAPAAGHALVATTDTLIAGVHFPGGTPPELIARKLLRVNLSDLAAMGATPAAYLLSVALPKPLNEPWLAKFCEGLREDQERFKLALIGGDTVATAGPAVFTVTALGEVPEGQALLRSGAKAGDAIFVSGTIGDGALGLRVMRGEFPDLAPQLRNFLLSRYHLPQPRVTLGMALRGIAHAAIDISDGFAADLAHICETSHVGAIVEWTRMPLSEAAEQILALDPDARKSVLAGGDDYELLFTAESGSADAIQAAAQKCGVPVTMIGRIDRGSGVLVKDVDGTAMVLDSFGYQHF